MLLAGLWCSTQKPPSFSFLEPVMNQLKDLEEKGIYIIHCPLYYIPIAPGIIVNIPEIGEQLVKGLLISAVVDLPAKAALLNCHQFNGEYSCSTCKHPGQTVGQFINLLYYYY